MKKQSFLIVAGGLMALASCTTEPTNENSDAYIDSAVNARVEEIRVEMMMSNDSFINQMALYKADSMCAVAKGQAPKPTKRPVAPKPPISTGTSTTTTTEEAKPVSTEPVNTGKKGDQTDGVNTGKKGNQTEGVNTGKKNN